MAVSMRIGAAALGAAAALAPSPMYTYVLSLPEKKHESNEKMPEIANYPDIRVQPWIQPWIQPFRSDRQDRPKNVRWVWLVLYHGPHPESLVRSVNFLEFVIPKQNSETVVALLRAN